MGRLDEALAALETGLMFEPDNAVSNVLIICQRSDPGSQQPPFKGIENLYANNPGAAQGAKVGGGNAGQQ